MKIAIFSDCFLDLTGGIVTTISAQKRELERRGHTVYVFSSAYKKSEKELAKLQKENIFPVKSCKFWGRGLTPIARRPKVIEKDLLKSHPELESFDVFYVHYEAGCSIAGLRLGKKLKKRTIQVMHGREDIGEQNLVPFGFKTLVAVLLNWFHSWYLPHPIKVKRDDYLATTIAGSKMWTLMVNHANFADLVLTPSQHFREKLLHYGVKKPVKVLPNGVSDDYFVPDLAPRELAPGESLRIIWHSRVSKEKRILPFLEALSYVSGPYHLDVYGDGNDLKKAQKYAKKRRLNVKFHGPTPFKKIYPEIIKSHLDVLNSYNFDTFGMTLIEAESAGTPALFVDPDLQEVIPTSGAILSAPSPTEVAKSIESLINNPEKITKMSKSMLSHRNAVRVSHIIDKLEKYFVL
ncbi:glycosyltransferase [Candidatus Saccharibacteria bacterium]|nr:glycosyltransferase [Candidatus Saccharibacteria bacterium]